MNDINNPIRILDVPIGRFAIVATGKHIGRVGYRTESAFFIVDDPTIDFLNTASIYADTLPESFILPKFPISSEDLEKLLLTV